MNRSSKKIHSASLFTAAVGIGACPKRRAKQSNPETGEDAHFLASTAKKIWAGVFDGVGGWADHGVDPSVFSAGLAKHCHDAATKDASALQVLTEGYEGVQKDVSITLGSSTACVASLDLDTGKVEIANLGDSGYLLVLADDTSTTIEQSVPQTLYFNCPYQLAKLPRSMAANSVSNKPSDASITSHDLVPNQYLILATDGFFDNIFPKDAANAVANCVNKSSSSSATKQQTAQKIADTLTEMAKIAGRGRQRTPFAVEAAAHRLRYNGGKEDDVCIIVIAIEAGPIDAKAKL